MLLAWPDPCMLAPKPQPPHPHPTPRHPSHPLNYSTPHLTSLPPPTPQVDMEDLGGPGPRRGAKAKAAAAGSGQPREMVTPLVRASLTKQGYKVLGSHSGVKMCRWAEGPG